MMLYTPRNSGDYAGRFNLQKAFVHFFHTVSTIPSLRAMFCVKPETKKLLNNSKKYTVHGIKATSKLSSCNKGLGALKPQTYKTDFQGRYYMYMYFPKK